MVESDQHVDAGQSNPHESLNDMYQGIPAGVSTVAPIYENKQKSKGGSGMLLLIAGLVALGGAAVFLLPKNTTQAKASSGSDDLGQGVAAESGIRGHLITQWDKNRALYKLKIDPIDPRANAGFDAVTANPSVPISIVVRILDSSGFALCGKEILLPYDPSNAKFEKTALAKRDRGQDAPAQLQAQEQSREQGKDVFRRVRSEDGKVEGLWSEGSLPCSPDQYQKFDYWDLQTNFPTMADQDKLLGLVKPEAKEMTKVERAAAAKRKLMKKPTSAFYMEGDDRVVGYEAARGALVISPNRTFFIYGKNDQQAAAHWADNGALIHFRCDQHAACALSHAGSTGVVMARMNE